MADLEVSSCNFDSASTHSAIWTGECTSYHWQPSAMYSCLVWRLFSNILVPKYLFVHLNIDFGVESWYFVRNHTSLCSTRRKSTVKIQFYKTVIFPETYLPLTVSLFVGQKWQNITRPNYDRRLACVTPLCYTLSSQNVLS